MPGCVGKGAQVLGSPAHLGLRRVNRVDSVTLLPVCGMAHRRGSLGGWMDNCHHLLSLVLSAGCMSQQALCPCNQISCQFALCSLTQERVGIFSSLRVNETVVFIRMFVNCSAGAQFHATLSIILSDSGHTLRAAFCPLSRECSFLPSQLGQIHPLQCQASHILL